MLNPKLLAEAFPINKVEVFFDAEDHSNFLGFQWEKVSQGRIPVGLNLNDTDFDTIGKTGGEKEHTLTINEMPSHNHGTKGAGNCAFANGGYTLQADNNGNNPMPNATTALTGGGQAHNNMPPYIVMAFWRRVA